ncbi:hypothetical protein AB0H82_13420 [Streptomyces sp. NPDC050732]|uniref:hypothetical protein n=1 Tax=Streptomyces sp. NPDC050732 TaxID=3154632 RepID=UPI0034134E8E
MSVPDPPRLRPTWPRALLTLLALLLATLATAPTAQAGPPPPAALAAEIGGEVQQDATETALRLPTRHATRLPTARPHATAPTPARRGTPSVARPGGLHPHVPTPRTAVLRC